VPFSSQDDCIAASAIRCRGRPEAKFPWCLAAGAGAIRRTARLRSASVFAALSIGLAGPATAEAPFSSVYVFGDSLSDIGRVPELIAAQDPGFPFNFPVEPPYFAGRFSNGPVYSELLPGLIGAAPAPEQNFAVGGAKMGDDNISDGLLEVLSQGEIDLPGVAEQIGEFVSSGKRFESDVVVVLYAGSGDYLSFPETNDDPTATEIAAFVDATVAKLERNIRDLAAAGASTILVPTIVDLGATPLYRGTEQQATETAFAELHSAALNARLGRLADDLGIEIVVADFASGFDLVRAQPERFGFTNVTAPCVVSAGALPPYVTPGTVCSPEEAATSLFFDNVHPTALGHQLLAEYAADTLLAPTTVPVQAELALAAGDLFLRQMESAARGTPSAAPAMISRGDTGTPPYEILVATQLSTGERDFEGSAMGFDYDIASIFAGVTFAPWDSVRLGLVAGYDAADADLAGGNGSVELETPRLGAHAAYDNGRFFASAGLAYGFDHFEWFRQTSVAELQALSDPNGRTLGAFGSAGYRISLGPVTLGPLLGLRYTHARVEDYSEEGAPGLDMLVQEQTAERLVGSAGFAAAARLSGRSVTFVPYVEISLEGALWSDDRTITTALVSVPDVPRHLELDAGNDAYGRLAGGMAVEFRPGLSLSIAAEATLARSGGDEYSALGRLTLPF